MPVRLETLGRVAVVVLDDPPRRNVLTAETVAGIVDAIERARSGGAAAIVVAGDGPAFCAGADLGDLGRAGATDEERAASLLSIYEGFLAVARCPVPTVAAVHGAAVGAGLNLALACDVRVVAESARFVPRFTELALHPGGGASWLLTRRAGPQVAAAMLLLGQTLTGARAVEVGLAWRCVPDDELRAAACELAAGVGEAPVELLERIKTSLRDVPELATHEEAVVAELAPQVWSAGQPAFAERLDALARKVSSRPAAER